MYPDVGRPLAGGLTDAGETSTSHVALVARTAFVFSVFDYALLLICAITFWSMSMEKL